MADVVVNNVANTEENRVADLVNNMKVDEVQTNGYFCTFSH